MATIFGVREQFQIVIGAFSGAGDAFCTVDVWAAGYWLTCDDNTAYVPHFAGRLQHSVTSLLHDASAYRCVGRPYPELSPADNYRKLCADENDDGLAYHFRFMDWGPTADNVRMLIFREGDTAILPFEFHRPDHHNPREQGQVFVAELPWRELAEVLHRAAWHLMWVWSDRSTWPR